jgi:peptide/nickel transport system substrate-binding protein
VGARNKFIVVALIALVAAATVAALVSARSADDAPPAFGGTYTEGVVEVGAAYSFNPLLTTTQVERDVTAILFTGLTRFDQKGAVVRDLAADFSVGDDGKSWTFKIRPDARWHDGAPVVADDVVYTVGITQDAAYRGPYAGSFAGATVERVDATTVRFVLPDVFAPFLEASTMPLLPWHRLRDVPAAQLSAHPFNLQPIGTGPFRFESRDESRIVLARNDDFYRGGPAPSRPYLDRVVLRLFPERGAALQALARNEIQAIAGLLPAEGERARLLREIANYYFPSDEATVLFFNLAPDRPTFRERAVRQAIALAINRSRIVQLAMEGHATVTDLPVPPSSWAHMEASAPARAGRAEIPRYRYAPDDAKAALDAAGWIDHDGDAVRDKGGVALRFSLLTNDDPPRIISAQQIQRDLGAVGIEVDLEVVSFAELVDERARERSFDAMVLAVSAGMDPDPYTFWHSSQTKHPGLNFTGYSTLALDRVLEQARRTLDRAERGDLYAQVFAQLAEDAPAVVLYFADYVYAIDRGVRGLSLAPLADPSQRFWSVENWYVRTVTTE